MRKLVRSQTAERLKTVEAELRRVARKPQDADAIHDLRVSIRRLSRELRVFGAWFEPKQVKSIRRPLGKLMEYCAAVRNCDVAIEVLRAAGWQDPELLGALEKEGRHTREDLAHKLASWRRRDRVRKWRGQLRVKRNAPQESTGDCARRLLPAMIENLFKAGREAAQPASSHHQMHQFRLKTKRVRYTLELFAPVYGEKTKPIMGALKGLQEKLGAINDCATTLEMIRRNRGAAEAVRRLAGARETEFRAYWKKHFGPRERVRWKAVLRAADRKK